MRSTIAYVTVTATLMVCADGQAGSPQPASLSHDRAVGTVHHASSESGHGTTKADRTGHGRDDANRNHAEQRATAPHSEPAASKDAHNTGSHWSYSGKSGPENWGRLSKDYELCLQGVGQSPIDIGGSGFDGATVAPIDFDYRLSPVEVANNGHTIQVGYAPGSGITVRGKRFELLQFHFHSPSEHAVGGRSAPMEVHLVHKSADGELAVVGVMMQEGDENMALSEFWNLMPYQAGESKRDKRVLINARDLLPRDTGYYRYMGSLTTPPCSEGVHWHVMAEPVSVSAEQIQQFAKLIGDNARPVQPVNRRLVLAPSASH